jgi:Domain of unknown function (DUF4249)
MNRTLIFILIVFSAACKEAYNPPLISTNHAFLVVEGFINNGPDSTVFTLSHTYKLNDSVQAAPEEAATVAVEGDDNSIYPLGEMGSGNYGAALSLNPARHYQLHIKTTSGKEYRSDFVPLKISPPLDSVNWKQLDGGIEIYANTHDPQNASTYYRWSYEETWEFHSRYFSEFQYLPAQDTVVARQSNDFYTCWKGNNSGTILLGSSARLGQDLIYEAPLLLVPQDSWHISLEYSVNVKQYVLTADAYNFWLNLQRNTEQLGSIFSPQPSETKGNIHSVSDPTEEVIGYISGGTLSQRRLFITPEQIPNWTATHYPGNCVEINLIDTKDSDAFYLGPNTDLIPVDMPDPPNLFPPFRYNFVDAFCADCTLTGTNIKPSFWP